MKKVWFLVGAIMLLFTMYQIATTYAKYVTEVEGSANKTAGAWVIKVNDEEISSSASEKEFVIDNLTYDTSEFVAEGKIAPSSTGYFDITIDPSGTSVAVRFDVTIDLTQLNAIEGINFQSASKVVGENEYPDQMTRTGANTYTGIISLNEVKSATPTTARFYFKWEDEGTEEGDSSDSQIGQVANSELGIPIRVIVSQYSGETITEYE